LPGNSGFFLVAHFGILYSSRLLVAHSSRVSFNFLFVASVIFGGPALNFYCAQPGFPLQSVLQCCKTGFLLQSLPGGKAYAYL
tara:strand:+ start:2053 stop:2301 length:249 start_codon:yes stop_codon:yes gene_type:complete